MDEFNNATDVYLRNIRDKIGVHNYNQILSSQGNSTLMFVMDTTGSMRDEIAASKAIANSIINATRDFEVDYILSPFNDPGKFNFNFYFYFKSIESMFLLFSLVFKTLVTFICNPK